MIERMKRQGCLDEKKIMVAYQTYSELREIDRLKNLICDYDADLDITYITENLTDSSNIYVPIHSTSSLTPSWIHCVQNKLSTNKPKSIILVIREADSTFVRHKLSVGLIPSQVDCKKFGNTKLDDTSDNETNNYQQGNKLKPGSTN